MAKIQNGPALRFDVGSLDLIWIWILKFEIEGINKL